MKKQKELCKILREKIIFINKNALNTLSHLSFTLSFMMNLNYRIKPIFFDQKQFDCFVKTNKKNSPPMRIRSADDVELIFVFWFFLCIYVYECLQYISFISMKTIASKRIC